MYYFTFFCWSLFINYYGYYGEELELLSLHAFILQFINSYGSRLLASWETRNIVN